MRSAPRWPLLLTVALAGGCAATGGTPDGPVSLAERVVHEAEALRELLVSLRVLFFPAVALAGLGLSGLMGLSVRTLWRLGFDPRRELAEQAALLRFGIAALVLWAMVGRLVAVAPLLSLVALGVVVAPITIALREQVQDVAVGLSLVARRRLREGDRVHLGEHAGIVRRVGLTRVELRRGDGTAIHVPMRLFGASAVVIARARHAMPVTVRVRPAPDRAAASEAARRTALCSPYRAVGTPVDVRAEPEGGLRVEIQAWSERASRDAAEQLEASLRRELAAR